MAMYLDSSYLGELAAECISTKYQDGVMNTAAALQAGTRAAEGIR